MSDSISLFLGATSFAGSRTFKPASAQLGVSALGRPKKVEGFDIGMNRNVSQASLQKSGGFTTVNGRLTGESTIKRQQQSTTLEQNIEEQYIKGLQDEAKLLEYELKLLKDKETEEQTNFTSFMKYFSDGVPINDNIIAMKNVFSQTQRQLSDKFKVQQQEFLEIQDSNAILEKEIAEYEERLKELQEIIAKKQDTFAKEHARFENMYFNEFYTAKVLDPEQKELQKKTRFFQGEIMVFNRNRDKELMIAGRKEAMDSQALEKLKKGVKGIMEIILEKHKQVDDRVNTDAFEHERAFLEEQNEILKKRILSMKTDLNMCTVKIAEQKFILENQDKERANEVQQRLAIQNRIFDVKELIEDQQKMTEGLVQAKVKELERDRVRAVEQEIEYIQRRQINLVQDRNEELEKNNDDIIYNKVELEKDLIDQENEEDTLNKKIKEAKERLHQLKVDLDIGEIKEQSLEEQIEPMSIRIDQLSKENPKRDGKVQDLQAQIAKAEQQLDLINQFNNFNFEEAKMAYASNNQINKSIEKLLREYRKITSS